MQRVSDGEKLHSLSYPVISHRNAHTMIASFIIRWVGWYIRKSEMRGLSAIAYHMRWLFIDQYWTIHALTLTSSYIYIYIYAPPCLACLYKMLIMKYWLSFDDHHNLSLMEKNYTVYPTPSSHSEVHKLWLQHLKSDEFVTSASRRWGASKA